MINLIIIIQKERCPMSKISKFGKELKRIRKSKGLTISSLSERTGVSSSYISQIENGKRDTPQPELIKRLSRGLGVDYFILMRIAGYLDSAQGSYLFLTKIMDSLSLDFKKQFLINFYGKEAFSKQFDIDDESIILNKFDRVFLSNATAGDYLKAIRLFQDIEVEDIAEKLSVDVDTYRYIEKNINYKSDLLDIYGEKIGESLEIGNFKDWIFHVFSETKNIAFEKDFETGNNLTEITFKVPHIHKKHDDFGESYYESYTPEELRKEFFNLDFILHQKDYDITYKHKILSERDKFKLQMMLDLFFGEEIEMDLQGKI